MGWFLGISEYIYVEKEYYRSSNHFRLLAQVMYDTCMCFFFKNISVMDKMYVSCGVIWIATIVRLRDFENSGNFSFGSIYSQDRFYPFFNVI